MAISPLKLLKLAKDSNDRVNQHGSFRKAGLGIAKETGKGSIEAFTAVYMNILRLFVRGIQILFALVVIVLYGSHVNQDRVNDTSQESQWVGAVAVASVSAVAALILAIPKIPCFSSDWKTYLFVCEIVLFLWWMIMFGVFAVLFHNKDDKDPKSHGGVDVDKMQSALWLNLVNSLFWFATGCYSTAKFYVGRYLTKNFDDMVERAFERIFPCLGRNKEASGSTSSLTHEQHIYGQKGYDLESMAESEYSAPYRPDSRASNNSRFHEDLPKEYGPYSGGYEQQQSFSSHSRSDSQNGQGDKGRFQNYSRKARDAMDTINQGVGMVSDARDMYNGLTQPRKAKTRH